MPFRHALQGSRYELKYVIDENCARAVREFVRCYLEPDEHVADKPNHEYAVQSLYLDSPDLALCRATVHGERNRFKLRIRFYDDGPESPRYFEIKRRLDSVIRKQRAAVRPEAVARLVAGHLPQRSDLYDGGNGRFGTLQHFCTLKNAIRAEGRIFVSYMREAYVTAHDNTVRVTFDRHLVGGRYRGHMHRTDIGDWVRPRVGGVVLEVKYTEWFPPWVMDMVRMFNLEQRSMAKYVTCVRALGRSGIPLGWTGPPPGLGALRPAEQRP